MNRKLPFTDHDVQGPGPQYLEDLATAYWFSEVLFASVDMDIFSILDAEGATAADLSVSLGADLSGLRRLADALVSLNLLTCHRGSYFNTKISSDHLVRGKSGYQGDSILWRRELQSNWKGLGDCIKAGGRVNYPAQDSPSERKSRIKRYIGAMDCIVRTKSEEILGFFEGIDPGSRLLDIGTGSGALAAAFLEKYPDMSATLVDLPEVFRHTKETMKGQGLGRRVTFHAANILDAWSLKTNRFDLVILSNIIHVYSGSELDHILKMAAAVLKRNGVIVVHDFFIEHCPEKAALSDLNMLINTYNGRVFSSRYLSEKLNKSGLLSSGLVPLESDTGVIFAAKSQKSMDRLCIDPVKRLMQKMQGLGFKKTYRLAAEDIVVSGWTALKCRYGCSRYGSPQCPPEGLSPEKTRSVISGFRQAILVEGEPPTGDFQKRVLAAEREAFLSGYHKAFSFWAGPCSICVTCVSDKKCGKTAYTRPSMEGAGIDVFATARRAGAKLRTLKCRTGFVKYFGLVLLD